MLENLLTLNVQPLAALNQLWCGCMKRTELFYFQVLYLWNTFCLLSQKGQIYNPQEIELMVGLKYQRKELSRSQMFAIPLLMFAWQSTLLEQQWQGHWLYFTLFPTLNVHNFLIGVVFPFFIFGCVFLCPVILRFLFGLIVCHNPSYLGCFKVCVRDWRM